MEPKQSLEPLFAALPGLIAQIPAEFASHQIILALAQRHQRDCVAALFAYRDAERVGTPAPFMIVYGALAQHLHELPHLVHKVGEVPSPDIFGETQQCARWRKV